MHWVAVLLMVVLIFGTKKLGSIGTDLGKAVKGFKDGVSGVDDKQGTDKSTALQAGNGGAIETSTRETLNKKEHI